MSFFGKLASGLSGAASGTFKATGSVAKGVAGTFAFYWLAGALLTILVITLIYQVAAHGFGGISNQAWVTMAALAALVGACAYKVVSSAANTLAAPAEIFDGAEHSVNEYQKTQSQSPYVVNLNGQPQPAPAQLPALSAPSAPSTPSASSVPPPPPATYTADAPHVAGGGEKKRN